MDLFNGWFKQALCPALKPAQVVILDNASFHKSAELFDMVAEINCKLIFLPPYSPDLNPIEKVWVNFKKNLRKVMNKYDELREAITQAVRKIFPG